MPIPRSQGAHALCLLQTASLVQPCCGGEREPFFLPSFLPSLLPFFLASLTTPKTKVCGWRGDRVFFFWCVTCLLICSHTTRPRLTIHHYCCKIQRHLKRHSSDLVSIGYRSGCQSRSSLCFLQFPSHSSLPNSLHLTASHSHTHTHSLVMWCDPAV